MTDLMDFLESAASQAEEELRRREGIADLPRRAHTICAVLRRAGARLDLVEKAEALLAKLETAKRETAP